MFLQGEEAKGPKLKQIPRVYVGNDSKYIIVTYNVFPNMKTCDDKSYLQIIAFKKRSNLEQRCETSSRLFAVLQFFFSHRETTQRIENRPFEKSTLKRFITYTERCYVRRLKLIFIRCFPPSIKKIKNCLHHYDIVKSRHVAMKSIPGAILDSSISPNPKGRPSVPPFRYTNIHCANHRIKKKKVFLNRTGINKRTVVSDIYSDNRVSVQGIRCGGVVN